MNSISLRCGKGNCEFYNKHNKTSGCNLYDDRIECEISLNHKRAVTEKSKINNIKFNL